MAVRWSEERQAVLETALEMARMGLVVGSSGNVSLRLSVEPLLVAITPSQRPYRSLRWEEIPVIDSAGRIVEGELEPSSERLLHLAVYGARVDVGAVIHCHPVYASVCAVAGLELPPIVDELVVLAGGAVRVAEYAFPGTSQLASNACQALGERQAVLLGSHGMLAAGGDLMEALEVCQLVERAAHIYVMARLLGQARTLPADVVAAEAEMFRRRGQAPEQG